MPITVPLAQRQVGQTPGFGAPGVAPFRDVRGQQLARLGQEVTNLGIIAIDVARQMQTDEDNARAKEADALLVEFENKEFYDPATGYMGKTGKDALGENMTQVQERLDRRIDELSSQLDNDEQRRLFHNSAGQWRRHWTQQMSKHAINQARNFHAGQSEARARAAAQVGVNSALVEGWEGESGAGYRQGLATAEAEIRAHGSLIGSSEEEIEQAVLAMRSVSHEQIVRGLAAEDRGTEAARYLDSVERDDILPETRTRLQAIVDDASVQETALRRSFELIEDIDRAQSGLEPGEQGPPAPSSLREQQVRSADMVRVAAQTLRQQFLNREITQEEHDAILDRVIKESQLRKQGSAERTATVRASAEQWLFENTDKTLRQYPFYRDVVDHGLLPTLTTFQRTGRYVNTPFVVDGIMRMGRGDFHRYSRPEFSEMVRGHMDNTTYNWAMSLWDNAHDPVKDSDVWTEKLMIRQTLKDSKLIDNLVGELDEEEAQKQNNVLLRYQALKTAARSAGQPITADWMQNTLDGIVSSDIVFVDGEQVPVVALTDETALEAYVQVGEDQVILAEIPGRRSESPGEIPDKFQKGDVAGKIVNGLVEKGIEATPQELGTRWAELGRPMDLNEYTMVMQTQSGSDGRTRQERMEANEWLIAQMRGEQHIRATLGRQEYNRRSALRGARNRSQQDVFGPQPSFIRAQAPPPGLIEDIQGLFRFVSEGQHPFELGTQVRLPPPARKPRRRQ
jgi:hypothetical protein